MTVDYMAAITERYARLGYAPYRWFEADGPPAWTSLRKPMREARLGLLTTSGAYVPGQTAFHYKDDSSIRLIPTDTPDERLHFAHITENYLASARRDPGCILPLKAARRLREEGAIGALADDAVSCMGGVYSQRRVREELIPAVAEAFAAQELDAALLVPM